MMMMAMTTSSSMSVKPLLAFGHLCIGQRLSHIRPASHNGFVEELKGRMVEPVGCLNA
jgi:hypothetical protein